MFFVSAPRFVSLAPLAGLLLLLAACSNTDASAVKQEGGPQQDQALVKPVPVAVEHVKVGDAKNRYVTTASLEAREHAEILARSTGAVRTIQAEEGDQVKENALLLQLEDDDQQLRLRQAEINLARQQTEFDRQVKMRESGVLAVQDFDRTQNALESAKAELDLRKLELSYTQVRAPFSGRIVRRLVDKGANVSPGVPLFQIMDVNPLLVRVHVPANRLGKVGVGQTLDVKIDGSGERLSAKIALISPIVDPESGTVKITGEIYDYPATIRPGIFAEISVITESRNQALLIPSNAIIEEQGQEIVYIANGERALRRSISSGFIDEGYTEITDGLTAADLIVIKGQRNLRDDATIEILEGPRQGSERADSKDANGGRL